MRIKIVGLWGFFFIFNYVFDNFRFILKVFYFSEMNIYKLFYCGIIVLILENNINGIY